MLTVYYSNQLELQKELLIHLLKQQSDTDPFLTETVLVQSAGMAQWLQLEIAQKEGIAGNIEFPFPTSFIWQQYRLLLPQLPKENIFEVEAVTWRLMHLIPSLLSHPAFFSLKNYLDQQDQLKLFQLAQKIAQLFDQYLVYRPHWLICWENNQSEKVLLEIKQNNNNLNESLIENIENEIKWQAILWNSLIEDLKKETDEIVFNTSHRAYLQQQYFEKLANLSSKEKALLPKRIFIFGISSLPASQIAMFSQLSQYCDIHLFFISPSQHYWGDILEKKQLDKIALYKGSIDLNSDGNPLLAMWGKQGRDFLNTLLAQNANEISSYFDEINENNHLLAQLKHCILNSLDRYPLNITAEDNSIQIHICHSPMREVEVLHNQLLALFEKESISAKQIIVMLPNIDQYAPYINAVFSRYEKTDPRYIPFTISDQKVSEVNPIISSFLQLLAFKENTFSAEEILDFLDIAAVREKFSISLENMATLRHWVKNVGIRAGIEKENTHWQNYNSWQNGLSRLLLGSSLKVENGNWQEIVAFDESYGLNAELVGKLAGFIAQLSQWQTFLQHSHSYDIWQYKIADLINTFYQEDEQNIDTLLHLQQINEQIFTLIQANQFDQAIDITVIYTRFNDILNEQKTNLQFLAGKVNFCTLLPMRAIPFDIVCLLGMNEADFPRPHNQNNFDLMQYAPQKGDRARRDDDRYLFLEALLSAKKRFYISYVGQSIINNEKRLPSILVSQLIDYITQNTQNSEISFNQKIITHPMTVFSRNNTVSYDNEWLKSTILTEQKNSDFLTDITHSTTQSELDLTDLISFIQNPIKYCFTTYLGVYLDNRNEQIEEAEIFALSSLERYQLFDKLLVSQVENEDLFLTEKLKGNLPAANFALVQQEILSQEIEEFKAVLKPYLTLDAEMIEIETEVDVAGKKIKLFGNIRNRFKQEVLFWRVGHLRDKDTIALWLTYLALQSQYPEEYQLKQFYKNKDKIECLTFSQISQSEALAILTAYVQDYFACLKAFNLVIYDDLDKFFKQLAENEAPIELVKLFLDSQAEKPDGIYLSRILRQQSTLDYMQIMENSRKWFEKMVKSKIIHKLNEREK